jgi:pimeloyl-ACP methyl ester carboxylesterase
MHMLLDAHGKDGSVAGGDDPIYPPALVEPNVRTVPSVRFVVVPGTAHLSAFEHPELAADELIGLHARINHEFCTVA